MKRFTVLLLCAALAVSCEDVVGPAGASGDDPLAECVLPDAVSAGGEALVQWNGFPADADIVLRSEEGDEYDVEVQVVTSSGMIFCVPADIPAGVYEVIMVAAGGRAALGTVEVTAAEMPVSGLNVPASGKAGETVVIDGIGFDDGCQVRFVGKDGVEIVLETEPASSGVSVLLPEDIAEGEYDVYIIQDGLVWPAGSSFNVYADIVEKALKRIEYQTPYVGSSLLRLAWDIVCDEPVTLTVSESVVDGDAVTVEAYDRYVCGTDGYFELVEDGFEASNDLGMSYVRDAEGCVTQADVLIYGDDATTPFVWQYDADGYLTGISSPKRAFRSFSYEAGNLTVYRNTSFGYGDPGLVNNPYAPDVVWGYMSVMEKNDPFVCFPYLLGWYDKASVLLPTVMRSPSPSGSGTVDYALSYIFDEDGYVTEMSWTEGSSLCSVAFIYD